MLSSIRAFLKSWFATALLSITIIALAITTFYNGNHTPASQRPVIQVGDHTVSDDMYKNAFQRMQQMAAQRTGHEVPLEDAIRGGLDQMTLQSLTGDVALSEMLRRMGIRASDQLVVEQIRRQQEFFNPVTNEFDPQAYRAAIGRLGFTTQQFEDIVRDSVAEQHFATAAIAGFQAPRIFAAIDAAFQMESRDASYVTVPIGSIPPPTPPTEAQLRAFVQAHAAEFRLPEMRVITVVRFSAQMLAPTLQVDDAAVEREFNFRRDALSTPEKRSFVQVPIRLASQAAQVAAALRAGQDPAAVARGVGTEAIVYDDKPLSAISDRHIGQAAFAMHVGEVSGAVQGDVGLAVLRLTVITPGHTATLAEARPEILNRLRAQAAEQRAFNLNEAYDRAHDSGSNLTQSAATAGIPVVTIGPIAENGASPQGGAPNPILTPQILQTAFHDLAAGQESDVIEVSRGESYAVRVERIQPSATARIEDFREVITQQYMRSQFSDALQARLEAIRARIGRGESLEAIAASVHGEVGHIAGLTRQAAAADQTIGQNFKQGIFQVRVGETFLGEIHNGVAAARLTAIHAGDVAMVAALIEQGRQQASSSLMDSIAVTSKEWSVQALHPRTDLARARRVLGVDPSMIPPGSPGATNSATNSAAPRRTAE